MRASDRTAFLTKPSLHRAGPGGRKKHIKRGAKRLSLSLSLSPAHWGALLFFSLGRHAITPRRWIFLLLSKQNRAVTLSCNTDLSKSYNTAYWRPESYNMACPRPESCDTLTALMSVTPNLWCDETRTEEHTLA